MIIVEYRSKLINCKLHTYLSLPLIVLARAIRLAFSKEKAQSRPWFLEEEDKQSQAPFLTFALAKPLLTALVQVDDRPILWSVDRPVSVMPHLQRVYPVRGPQKFLLRVFLRVPHYLLSLVPERYLRYFEYHLNLDRQSERKIKIYIIY